MKDNKFVKKAYDWMERVANVDGGTVGDFTGYHGKLFGAVLQYLERLEGNENKRKAAVTTARIVGKCAPYVLSDLPPTNANYIIKDFQDLANDLED
jgi:hypothetical protein